MDYVSLIDTVYENTTIYQGFAVYNSNDHNTALYIANSLIAKDYPVIFYFDEFMPSLTALRDDKYKYRLFFISDNMLPVFFLIWTPYYSNINFVLLVGGQKTRNNFMSITKRLKRPDKQVVVYI
jgi:hypothetical protein